jgi:metallo-beta-lactamase family protein
MTVTLTFHGAARTVTGSCYRLAWPGGQLLVDCGLFQGSKTVKELNYGNFPFDPAAIDAVLLTHAHIDHSGLVPKLCRLGFTKDIVATQATADLLTFMLPDSGHIQEIEVEQLNRRNAQRGRTAVQPIYTREQAEACLRQVCPVAFGRWVEVAPGIQARFWNAGHLLGSASIELMLDEQRGGPLRLLFSGDLGPGGKPFHADPEAPTGLDAMIVESTYGDRHRDDLDVAGRRALLGAEITAALKRGGNVIMPAFAVERTQELLADLVALTASRQVPRAEIFLDSPLAIRVTEVFEAHAAEIGAEVGQKPQFRAPGIHVVESAQQSRRLSNVRSGAIILTASGMCDAGRVRHHLKNSLWRRNDTILLTGYQAPGTMGRLLQEGTSRVRIFGEEIVVRAAIRSIDVYSGHADRGDLLRWLQARGEPKGGLFITHGEEAAMTTLKGDVAGLGWKHLHLPQLDHSFELVPGHAVQAVLKPAAPPRLTRTPAEDWHNLYARTLLKLSERLPRLPDDKAREKLLRKVSSQLEAKDGPAGR